VCETRGLKKEKSNFVWKEGEVYVSEGGMKACWAALPWPERAVIVRRQAMFGVQTGHGTREKLGGRSRRAGH